jgi:uncharacterized protein (TIGR00251 family)
VVRVQPNAKRTHVGGRHGDQEPPVLKVRVAAPAVDGKANAAVVAAVADALVVPARAVRLVAGAASRTKTLTVEGADAAAVQLLLDAG